MEIMLKNKCCLYVIISIRFFSITICNLLIESPSYFDGENISFDASLVIHINSTNIPPIMITNRIYQNLNLLSL